MGSTPGVLRRNPALKPPQARVERLQPSRRRPQSPRCRGLSVCGRAGAPSPAKRGRAGEGAFDLRSTSSCDIIPCQETHHGLKLHPQGVESSVMPRLPLDDMHERHRALTVHLAGAYAEAASVCLARHHVSPTSFEIEDNANVTQAEVHWEMPDLRAVHAWNNANDATRDGAYACIIAAVELLRELFAVRRAETATGCDYYIGLTGSGVDDLEGCIRLEISGVDYGDRRDVRRRLLEKAKQARDGESSLPAVAGVVGYAARLIMMSDVLEAP